MGCGASGEMIQAVPKGGKTRRMRMLMLRVSESRLESYEVALGGCTVLMRNVARITNETFTKAEWDSLPILRRWCRVRRLSAAAGQDPRLIAPQH